MKDKTILYISYDGMTDPLGQSQVIPYLRELSALGYSIDILSAEKPQNYSENKELISKILAENNIGWKPVFYTKKPPVLSTIKDIRKLRKTAKKLMLENNYSIVHCRSYIAAFTGIYLKKKFKTKFLFDMRGFFADERVDGGLWCLSNPVYKQIYRYFKRKEVTFFNEADHIISLTKAGKEEILRRPEHINAKISVIPCCADLNHFDYQKIAESKKKQLRQELGLKENDFVLTYLGSTGTWYMPDEMLSFFKILKEEIPNAKFFIITRDDKNTVLNSAEKAGVSKDGLIIKPANRNEVPSFLSISNWSVFFIKPVFSKKASSPTKLAELSAMGIPFVCNTNVGDVEEIVNSNKLGITISEFSDNAFRQVVKEINGNLSYNPKELRNIAYKLFSLEIGVKKYSEVYENLLSK
jgi:glycosyltransferase involved in cell wall biosynthesis